MLKAIRFFWTFKMDKMNKPPKKAFREYFLPWLSPAGAILILICFFLPWLEVRCSGKKIIGSGFTFADKAFPLWLIPIFAFFIILLFFWYQKGLPLKWFKIGTILFASLGLIMMILTYIAMEQKLSGFIIRKITSHQIKVGLIGTVFGFVFMILTAFGIKRKKTS